MNQYLSYLWEIGKGNPGFSLYYNEPVGKIIAKRLVWTGFLVITTVMLSTLLGTALGSLSAWFRDRWVDKAGKKLCLSCANADYYQLEGRGIVYITDSLYLPAAH